MRRLTVPLLGFGLVLAQIVVFQVVANPFAGSGAEPADPGRCFADIDLPLEVELEASAITSPGVRSAAICRVLPRRSAERIELSLRASGGARLDGPAAQTSGAVGAGHEASFDLAAVLAKGQPRGTVDVVVTAWIDGLPYERGVTWSLAAEPPATGRVVARASGLAVREIAVGRATR